MEGDGVSEFFYYESKFKIIFWGRGDGGARVSAFFTLNPNLKNIKDIYFFRGIQKYISSNVMKISVNSRVRSTSEFSNIFDK